MSDRVTITNLLRDHPETYAEQAGIKLADKPSPLFRLLVLALLLSARISAEVAVAAARELFGAGYRTPGRMADASWQDRVDALGRGHYRRYDERTSTMLGSTAERVRDRWGGDLRRLHREAGGDTSRLKELLTEFDGIGPAGADIYLREVQAVWPDVAPYFDRRALEGAKRAGLPADAERLGRLAKTPDRTARLSAALIRKSR